MREDVREALESARTVSFGRRRHARDHVRALVLGVIRELPDDMTMSELREELEGER